MAYLELSFFNSFDVNAQGKRVANFRSAKVAGLLVYLVLEAKTTHARDRLAALFWPDEPETRAKKNLRQTLYQLRKLVGEADSYGQPLLDITRQTVQFNPESDTELDVALFQGAIDRGALDLAETYYTGPLLPTFSCDSRPFDNWLNRKRHTYQQAALGALHELTERQLALGKSAISRVLALARRQLDLEPWREEAHRQLMRGLALSGDRSGAIAQFDVCSDVLADELGVSPAPETFALFEAIRDGTFPPADEKEEAATVPNNIPHQATPLVGRAAEIDQLLTQLHDPSTRLITIVGPGGMGKTRLTLETARVLLDADDAAPFPNGIFLVELAAATSREEMLAACATAFGFALEREPEPLQQIVNFLANKQLLLLLDNVEQLIAPPASVAEVSIALLKAAPSLNILVTSRQKLNLTGERVLPLGGLALPDEASTATVESSDAMQLFAESARRVQPTFQLTDHNAPQVANICRLAAGMPLGILLSAAWSHLLTPAEIAAEMQADVDFVAVEMPDLPTRQRSMRAVFDHSWALLSQPEQQILAKLSVFRGGFTRESAQAVTGATLPDLLGLINKSLLQRDIERGRFNLHELVRQLAAAKLAVQGDIDTVCTAHSHHYLSWLARHQSGLIKHKQIETIRIIRADHQNLLTAWLWAASRGDSEHLLSVMRPLRIYFSLVGREADAITLFSQTLQILAPGDRSFSDIGDPITFGRARLLNYLQEMGVAEDDLGNPIDIQVLFTYFKARGDKLNEALVCQHLGFQAMGKQDFSSAAAYFQTQLRIYEQEGDVFRLLTTLGRMGLMLTATGQVEAGRAISQRMVALTEQHRHVTHKPIATGLQLIFALYGDHDYEAANAHAVEMTARALELSAHGLATYGAIGGYHYQGVIALLQGDLTRTRHFHHKMRELAAVRNNPTDNYVVEQMSSLIMLTNGQYDAVNVHAFERNSLDVFGFGKLGQALLGCAQGNLAVAARHVVEAWSRPITMRWHAILLQYVPVAATLLTHSGEYARAVSLLTMARGHPAAPHGWWQIMVLMQALEAQLQKAVSADELAAAQAMGLKMDAEETATALLDQFRAMAV